MQFRTEINIAKSKIEITHRDKIVMLGSCFTDNIGKQLQCDGFDVCYNPMGPLYNPYSIVTLLEHAIFGIEYAKDDLAIDEHGIWHCLDYASRYQGNDADHLLAEVNAQVRQLGEKLRSAHTVIITLGTSYVYRWIGENGPICNTPVGNCHKFPASCFSRARLSLEQAISGVGQIACCLSHLDIKQLIFTVSPIRHTGDGLHDNELSKSTLLLAIDNVVNDDTQSIDLAYFPSYEIMIDDLRDYRFYAADMKHPSDVAIEYIYQKFSDTYFSKNTQLQAADARREYLRSQHRPIL